MPLLDSVRKAIEEGDGDFLRETVHLLAQGVMETEVTEIRGCQTGIGTIGTLSRARGQSREVLGLATIWSSCRDERFRPWTWEPAPCETVAVHCMAIKEWSRRRETSSTMGSLGGIPA